MSDHFSIKDPTKLFEIKDEKHKTFCNWYEDTAIKKHKLFDTTTPLGVVRYADIAAKMLATFAFADTLYSIYCTDSATILAKHLNFKLIAVDTLLKHKIDFWGATTHSGKDVSITSY